LIADPPQKRRRRGLELLLVVATLSLTGQLLVDPFQRWIHRPRLGMQISTEAELLADEVSRIVRYWVYLPQGYSQAQKWPLLLFLHGSGLRGDDINRVLREGPPAFIASGRHLPMIVVSPQCPANLSWENDKLLALLDHLQEQFAVDPDRVYLSGNSMGGFGAWQLASAAPDHFAALVPTCGGGNVELAARLASLPIWAFHGEKDTTVPLDESRKMVDAVNAAGGHAQLTIYPGKGHNICSLTFLNENVYQWLLQQRRGK
jgi:predicted peptidase